MHCGLSLLGVVSNGGEVEAFSRVEIPPGGVRAVLKSALMQKPTLFVGIVVVANRLKGMKLVKLLKTRMNVVLDVSENAGQVEELGFVGHEVVEVVGSVLKTVVQELSGIALAFRLVPGGQKYIGDGRSWHQLGVNYFPE